MLRSATSFRHLMVSVISSRENTECLPNVRTVKGSVYEVPFRPGSFDYIYCIGALHHMPDPEGAFRELLKYLKPGGSIFVWVYSKTRGQLNAMLESGTGPPIKSAGPRRTNRIAVLDNGF